MTTWFTADTHFGHDNIIKYCNRPFTSTETMTSALIQNWNAAVQPEDEVWHLGDFAYGRGMTVTKAESILRQLHGNITFIRGNLDQILDEVLRRTNRIHQLSDYEEIEVQGQRIVLFHYGLRTWHHDLRSVWHLYGHSHGGLPPLGKSLDVGVDVMNFRPVSFEFLKQLLDGREVHKAPAFANFNSDSQASCIS